MSEIEKIKIEYQKLKEEHKRIIDSFKNYKTKTSNEIKNINDILEKQPFTFFYSEDYYKAQRMEKLKLAQTINNILEGDWAINEKGEIVELHDGKE